MHFSAYSQERKFHLKKSWIIIQTTASYGEKRIRIALESKHIDILSPELILTNICDKLSRRDLFIFYWTTFTPMRVVEYSLLLIMYRKITYLIHVPKISSNVIFGKTHIDRSYHQHPQNKDTQKKKNQLNKPRIKFNKCQISIITHVFFTIANCIYLSLTTFSFLL